MTQPTEAVPSLTEDERRSEFVCLPSDDCGYMVAALFVQFPAVFDAALNELKCRPSGLEEVTH